MARGEYKEGSVQGMRSRRITARAVVRCLKKTDLGARVAKSRSATYHSPSVSAERAQAPCPRLSVRRKSSSFSSGLTSRLVTQATARHTAKNDTYMATLMQRMEAAQEHVHRERRPFRFWREERALAYTPVTLDLEIWYGARPTFLCVRTRSGPGTLGNDILLFRRDLPGNLYGCDAEIDGDTVTRLCPSEVDPLPSEEDEEDEEEYVLEADVAPTIALLPIVTVNEEEHYVKTCYFKSEIENLQRCVGCPGVVQLLGRSSDGQLVLARHGTDLTHFWPTTIAKVKHVLLGVIDALDTLHARGIVHRDLMQRNILMDKKGVVVLCDLESQYSSVSCRAPELGIENPTYTVQSDVYALGTLMWCLCYRNNPRMLSFFELFPVPAPF
jgi:hypothetical protein